MLKFSSSYVRKHDLSLTEQHFQIQTSCCTCCPHCWHMITFCHSWLRLHAQSNLADGHIVVEVSFQLSCLRGPLMLHKTMNKPWINPMNKPNNRLFLVPRSQDGSPAIKFKHSNMSLAEKNDNLCIFWTLLPSNQYFCNDHLYQSCCCLNLTLHK